MSASSRNSTSGTESLQTLLSLYIARITRRTPFFTIAAKTAQGVFDTPLNPVWDVVAPKIITLFKERSIKYSALLPVRFSSCDEEGKKTLSPITLWISTHIGRNKPEDARDTSPHVLKILEDHGVTGAVTQWYEGSVEKLASLMKPSDSTNPTFHVRHTLMTALGLPLAIAETQSVDAQGSLGFYFHEGANEKGEPSDKVFGLSCAHVLCANTTVGYKHAGEHTGMPKQRVHVCSFHRFQQTIEEIMDLIDMKVKKTLATEITNLEAQGTNKDEDEDEAQEVEQALTYKREDLKRSKQDSVILEKFLKDVLIDWANINARNIGHVDYAPKIDARVDEYHYTRDFATFKLEETKFRANFIGNVVDLGACCFLSLYVDSSKYPSGKKYTPQELKLMFWTNNANRLGFKFPANRLLKIDAPLTRELLARPDCLDENGDPMYIVGKNGGKTGLTLGRYSALDGYICNEFGVESREVVAYNFDKTSGNFSDHGDSGSLIWTGHGGGVAILHSGMPRGTSSHVTFGTPM